MTVTVETRTRGDFVVLHVSRHLTRAETTLPDASDTDFPCAGEATEKVFYVDAAPVGPGHLTLQLFGLRPSKFGIAINGKTLPLPNDPPPMVAETWSCWTEVIPEGCLAKGRNTVSIQCTETTDDFLVRDVMVHWHEPVQ